MQLNLDKCTSIAWHIEMQHEYHGKTDNVARNHHLIRYPERSGTATSYKLTTIKWKIEVYRRDDEFRVNVNVVQTCLDSRRQSSQAFRTKTAWTYLLSLFIWNVADVFFTYPLHMYLDHDHSGLLSSEPNPTLPTLIYITCLAFTSQNDLSRIMWLGQSLTKIRHRSSSPKNRQGKQCCHTFLIFVTLSPTSWLWAKYQWS